MNDGSNRLPILAAEIRCAHADVQDAAKTAAERAIAAGKALIEAKQLVKHGQWLPWLREHCALPERTAQLYMQVSASGHTAEVIAAVGLKGAAEKVEVFTYDPFAGCSPEATHDWHVFMLFLVSHCCLWQDDAEGHLTWILRRGYVHPDEWMGEEGTKDRKRYNWNEPNDAVKACWKHYLVENRPRSLEDMGAELGSIQAERGEPPSKAPFKKRRKRKSVTVADLEGGAK